MKANHLAGYQTSDSDFVVGTEDHCFLCLNEFLSGSESESATDIPTHSLQYLSRYLRLDLDKVFSDEFEWPPALEKFSNLERSQLKSKLCKECASLNDRFSELCGLLERIQMEVEHCLSGIHERLTLTQIKLERQRSTPKSVDEIRNRQIAEAVRKHTVEKCSLRLRGSRPRVVLSKFKMDTSKPFVGHTGEDPKAATVGEVATASSLPVKEEGPDDPVNFDLEDPHVDDDDFDDDEDSDSNSDSDDSVESESTPASHPGHDPSTEMVECDICHLQVYDLSAHHYTSHFQGKREVGEVLVMEPEPVKLQKSPALPVPPRNPIGCGHSSKVKRQSHRGSLIGRGYSYNATSKKWLCSVCGKEFNHRTGWSIHYRNIHLKVRYKCPSCKKDFSQLSALRTHEKALHRNVMHECQVCGKQFTQRNSLRRHHDSVHLGKRYPCEVCSQTFNYDTGLVQHYKVSPACQEGMKLKETQKT